MIRRTSMSLGLGLLAALLWGCANPSIQPGGDVDRPPELLASEAVMDDGYRLPYWHWLPKGEPRSVVLALHGFNDYRNAFSGVGPYLADRGHAVYAYDQRGFGETAHRGMWPGSSRLVQDAELFAELLAERHPGVPIHVLGESMGGAVASLAVRREDPVFDGAVLVAPAVWGRETMRWYVRALLWITAHTFPGSTWSGRGLDIRPSDNTAMLRGLGRDSGIIRESRADALWGLTGLMDRALAGAGTTNRPLLVLYGERDQVIPREPTCRFLSRLPGTQPPHTVAYYPEGYHMLLRDLSAETVLADIAAWLDGAPSLPSGYALERIGADAAPLCGDRRPTLATDPAGGGGMVSRDTGR